METFDHVMQYGWPTVALAAVGYALWRIVKWLAPRVDRYFERWEEYLDKDEARADKQLEVCAIHAKALADTGGDVASLKKAAMEGCSLCRTWSQAFPEQEAALNQHIDAMERIISETH